MPIIDVSQKSYRSLVKAAHKRGMSIDRFIQKTLEDGGSAVETEKLAPVIQFSATQHGDSVSETAPDSQRAATQSSMKNHPNTPFDDLWEHVAGRAGHSMSTKRGQDFTYEIESGYLVVIESGVRIPKSQFKKALDQWPQSGPSGMRGIYAASIVWAVLADERILARAAA